MCKSCLLGLFGLLLFRSSIFFDLLPDGCMQYWKWGVDISIVALLFISPILSVVTSYILGLCCYVCVLDNMLCWWTGPFLIIKCPLSLATVYVLKFISWFNAHVDTLTLLILYVSYLFPFLLQSICVFATCNSYRLYLVRWFLKFILLISLFWLKSLNHLHLMQLLIK